MVHSRKTEKTCPYLLMETSNLQGGDGERSPWGGCGVGREAPLNLVCLSVCIPCISPNLSVCLSCTSPRQSSTEDIPPLAVLFLLVFYNFLICFALCL